MLNDQHPCPRSHWRVKARARIHTQVCAAPNLAIFPITQVPSLNCTAGSVEVSVLSLSLLWGSFPTPAASQKANYACQWPASSNRIGDGCAAISASAWSASLWAGSQEAPAAQQQVIAAACFCRPLSPNCSFQTSLLYITHLPWIPLSPSFQYASEACRSQLWHLRTQHQKRVESSLSSLLTDRGEIPLRLI